MQLKFDLFNEKDNEIELDKQYTHKIQIPQYEITGKTINSIYDLFDIKKYLELCSKIKKSNITNEQKTFLQFAATRHIIFNYSLIAEYYAQSSKEMQELMEQSALVIIDINNAISNGYVRLSEEIENIMKASGLETKEGFIDEN